MSQPIDTLYVDVESRGEEDAARDVQRAARDMERYLDDAARDIERDFQRAAREMATSLSAGAEVAERAVDDLADGATRDLRRIEREARDAGTSIGKYIGGGAGGAGLVDSLSQLGAQLRNISALAPPPIFLAIIAAVPAVIALGGAVADLSALLLLLPGGIAALVSSVAALKLAFSGVGAAIEAIASGDLEKINETMKELAPSARAFAREVAALKKPLDDLKRSVQESFFAPLKGDIAALGRVLFPVLKDGLSGIGGAFGRLASDLTELLGEVDILNDLGNIFESTARIIDNLAPHITELLGTLFGVADRGMPFLERAFDALGRGMDSLAGFLGDLMQSGDFETFLNDAFQIMSDLGDLTKAVFGLLGALFGDMGDEGSTFIQTLTRMTEELTAFLNSAEGQAILQRIVDTLPLLIGAFETGMRVLGAFAVLTEMTFQSLEFLGGVVVTVGKAIGEFFGNFDNWTQSAISAVGDFFGMIGGFFTQVGGFFADIGAAISGAITWLIQFITTFVSWITNLNNVANAVGFALGFIIGWFLRLRDMVTNAFISLGQFIFDTWIRLQQFLVTTTLNIITAVGNFFAALPGRIRGAVTAVWNTIVDFFTRSRNAAVDRTTSLFNTVTRFFRELPLRIRNYLITLPGQVLAIFNSIATRAVGIGRSILDGIMRGIRNGYSAAVNAAKNFARGILNGMKSALGIASPSALAAAEIGEPIMQGVGVGAARGAQDLRNVINSAVLGGIPGVTNSTQSVNAGQTVTFAPGAVQVVFQGAVPTQQEALRTGQAVGAGIANTLARRSVRTAVRIA